jgi:probable addiction module antidote protein
MDNLIICSTKKFIIELRKLAIKYGITKLSKKVGLTRTSMYKTLQEDAKPRFDSIIKILNGLDIDLKIVKKPK